ncbi:MAG: 50S ribosomal protein L29 [Gemmatimonadota bacterium]
MDPKRIRELTEDEMDEELERARKELFNLKFRATYEELENPALLRHLRREIARLKTIRHERRWKLVGESHE